MVLEHNIHFRVSDSEKKIIEQALEIVNQQTNKKVGYRFLTVEKSKEIINNKYSGLEFKKENLLKEIEQEKQKEEKAKRNISLLEIELTEINHKLNNKTIFDISNYQYDKPKIKGFNRLKEIVLNPDNNINEFEDITETIFKQIQESFKIKDLDVFKNIVKNHFNEWRQEKQINTPPEPQEKPYNERINLTYKLFTRHLKGFNTSTRQDIKPLKFLNDNESKYKKMCEDANINFEDFKDKIIHEN